MSVYDILQVKPDASDEEIKVKYKELARQYHPDKNNGDDSKMVELNEAYHLIDTPEKRKEYDSKNAFVADFNMLSSVFGRPTVAENFHKAPKVDPKMKNGTDVKLRVKIPVDVYLGGVDAMPIKFNRMVECLECDGTGGGIEHVCNKCGGYGYVLIAGQTHKCDRCNGEKKIKANKCPVCNGAGVVKKQFTKVIRYVPGALKMRVPNAGNSGIHGGTNGHLMISFTVTPVNGINYDPVIKAVPVTVEVYPEDIVLGVTKVINIGNWSTYLTLEPKDFDTLPVRKSIGKVDLSVSIKVSRSADDIKRAQDWRNSRINDVI
jgi:molecular chaperone DnaJ